MANELLVKLAGKNYGFLCHDKRERDAILSCVPYLRDRIINVHILMVEVGHDPYTLWGLRSWGSKGSLHPKGKAYDTCDWFDLQRRGGTGWNTSDRFKADLIVCYTLHELYSGVNWYKYGKPWGDFAHGEWRGGKVARLSAAVLAVADGRLVRQLDLP